MVKNNTGIADFFVFDTKNSIFVKRYCEMSTKGKLKDRFCSLPNDFTFEELVRLFSVLGFELDNKGKSSGSRVAFTKGDETFTMHKSHPGNIVKKGTLKFIKDYLADKGLLTNTEEDHGKTQI